jgi:hypothetical protein
VAAGDDEMAKGRGPGDHGGVGDESGGVGGRKGTEQDGAFFEGLAGSRSGVEQWSHAASILTYGKNIHRRDAETRRKTKVKTGER